jgi:hypothetical protein
MTAKADLRPHFYRELKRLERERSPLLFNALLRIGSARILLTNDNPAVQEWGRRFLLRDEATDWPAIDVASDMMFDRGLKAAGHVLHWLYMACDPVQDADTMHALADMMQDFYSSDAMTFHELVGLVRELAKSE